MSFAIEQIFDTDLTPGVPYLQDNSRVAALDGGGWVVTWKSLSSGFEIYQSVFAADGTPLIERAMVDNNLSAANDPSVAALDGGGWVVTWPNGGIRQSVYAPDGSLAKIDGVTIANKASVGSGLQASVAGLADGGWVVSRSTSNGGPGGDAYVTVYKAGYKAGDSVSDIQVANTANNELNTSVAALGNGFVVTWQSKSTTKESIFQSVFNEDLDAVVDKANISGTLNYQKDARVAALDGGNWVVTWQNTSDDLVNDSVYAPGGSLAMNGAIPIASSAIVNETLFTLTPDVSGLDGGGWVVVWTSPGAGGPLKVWRSVFAADGSFVSKEVRVSTGQGFEPSVAALDGGGYVVTWTSDDTNDVHQRVFDILTTSPDRAKGSGLDDTLAVGATTLGPGDIFDGGGGADDTLILSGGGFFDFGGVSLTSIEHIDLAPAPFAEVKGTFALLSTIAAPGAADEAWIVDANLGAAQRSALYATGFETIRHGGKVYTLAPGKPTIAATSVDEDAPPTKITIARNALDGDEITHFKIDLIRGGTLYLDAAATVAVSSDGFVASGGATTDVFFKPDPNFRGDAAFTVQASLSDSDDGVGDAVAIAKIFVKSVDDGPSGISVSGGVAAEGAATGTAVASLAGIDSDEAIDPNFSLVDTAGGRFAIAGTSIVVANGLLLDYEQATSHTVVVRLTDGGFIVDKMVTIAVGDVASENLTGSGDGDVLKGGAKADIFNCAGGNDRLFGGGGKDTLTGGAGKDIFVFDTKPAKTNVDRVTDFSVRDDSFYLDNAAFAKLGKAGTPVKPVKMKADVLHLGAKAGDGNDYILYDKKTGALSYDSDGSGAKAAVQIALLAKNLKLTAADFFVI